MKIGFLIVAALFLYLPTYADDSTFCEDPKMWKYFESMAQKYPDDIPLQLLHALKIGLCEKVADNTIRLDAAIKAFNSTVDEVAKQRDESTDKRGKDL